MRIQILSQFFSSILVLIMVSNSPAYAGVGRYVTDIDETFATAQVGVSYSAQSYENLLKLVSSLSQDAQEKQIEKTAKKINVFLAHAQKILSESAESEQYEKEAVYFEARRVVYAALAVQKKENEVPKKNILANLGNIPNMIGSLQRLTMPSLFLQSEYIPADQMDSVIPKGQASLESEFLVNPVTRESLRRNDVQQLTYRQVSELDISASSPMLLSDSRFSPEEDYWQTYEDWMNTKLKEQTGSEKYELHQARRILFFDKVKDTATAAKVDVEDPYGVEWKLKWGDEVPGEVVANRLYMAIGSKVVDLVYANGHEEKPTLLVLEKADAAKKAKAEAEGQCYPVTYAELKNCLKESVYKFSTDPYKLSEGVLTEQNIPALFADIDPAVVEKSKADWIGRTYITMKESLVELQPEGFLVRGAGVDLDGTGAMTDRASRSMMLFDMWIWNKDAKDDNSKAYLALDFWTQENAGDWSYLEAQHDMGAALGGTAAQGQFNLLGESNFVQVLPNQRATSPHRPEPSVKAEGYKLYFPQSMIYTPDAWAVVSFSDLRWMARRISAVNLGTLERVADSIHWPDFAKKAVFYKMAARRNKIAEVFHTEDLLDEIDLGEGPSEEIEVSRATIPGLAKRFDLKEEDLYRDFNAKVQLRGKNPETDSFSETLLKKGQIGFCKHSIVIRRIQLTHYPSGIVTRGSRVTDGVDNPGGCPIELPNPHANRRGVR